MSSAKIRLELSRVCRGKEKYESEDSVRLLNGIYWLHSGKESSCKSRAKICNLLDPYSLLKTEIIS